MKLKRNQNEKKQKTIENENENVKTAKLVTQQIASIQYSAYGWGPYGVESVTNGGRYLGRSSTRLRQQVW